ncbi:hypothetical protein JCM1841_006339 [Sporobolomyces salmonicolor]
MLVGFGQEICRPVAPRCELCDVAAAKLCPSRRRVVVASPIAKKKLMVEEVKEEAEEEEDGEAGKPKVEVGIEEPGVGVRVEEDAGVLRVKEEETVERVKREVAEDYPLSAPRATGGAALS